MAEERIICLHIGSHLRTCPLMKNSGYCILDCGCDQLEGIKCNKGFTRTEAIERMAKAINKERCRPALCANSYWKEDRKELLRQAEAALDALVGKGQI